MRRKEKATNVLELTNSTQEEEPPRALVAVDACARTPQGGSVRDTGVGTWHHLPAKQRLEVPLVQLPEGRVQARCWYGEPPLWRLLTDLEQLRM